MHASPAGETWLGTEYQAAIARCANAGVRGIGAWARPGSDRCHYVRVGWRGRAVASAVVVVLLSTLASCSSSSRLTVDFFGDSELDHARAQILIDQDTHARTVVYAEPGCGLLVDGPFPFALPGYRYCNHDENTTQARVDAFWKREITAAEAHDKPRYIEVELGLNDTGHTVVQLTDFWKQIEQFLSWLPRGTPVLWDNLPDLGPALAPQFRAVDRALDAVRAETPNLYVVDVRAAFKGHWPQWFGPDRVHLNQDGQQAFAKVNCEALMRISGGKVGTNCDAGAG